MIYTSQRLDCLPHTHLGVARHLLDNHGDSIFGVFASQIGLPRNTLMVIADRPLPTPPHATIPETASWAATIRPAPGATIIPTTGIITHRWFTVLDENVDLFLKLSADAWDNFEGTNQTEVIGLWRNLAAPAPGVTELRLMTWYSSLTSWDASRLWRPDPNPATAPAHANFRARGDITLDSTVTVTGRII